MRCSWRWPSDSPSPRSPGRGAPAFYRLLGGSGAALESALAFSNLWYGGAVIVWLSAFLAALLRGAGNSATPARIGTACSLAYVPLAGLLALGVGAWPGLGMAGPAIASIASALASMVLLGRALGNGRLGFVPALRGVRLQRRLFGDVLRVGMVSIMGTLIANATALLVTGLVGRFGAAALAGYGVGVRLEFMLAPLAFGIGTGLVTLVGVAAGAGDWKRAVRVAWIGGLIAFATIGTLGWIVASRLFATDPAVVAVSAAYITRVAPVYCLFGLGLTLYFASQGAGRMTAPFLAGVARPGGDDERRLARRREMGLGPRRRVRGDRAWHRGLWRPERRASSGHAVERLRRVVERRARDATASRTSARTRPWACGGSGVFLSLGSLGLARKVPSAATLKPEASTSLIRNAFSMRCSVPDSEMPVPGRPA